MKDIKNKQPQEELAVLGEKSGVEQEIDDETSQEPFDPKQISISSKSVTLDSIIRRLKSNALRLSPDFQRNVVWDNKRKSQLIESLMLNIPIAIFYVADDGEGNWDVVDGLQRLTAIKEFVVDKKLKLEGLEFWKQYDNAYIDNLPPLPYNQIMETEFNFVIIEPKTPESVKYNIFKRINIGGLPLSNQEIRHALYQGEGTRLLLELSESSDFLSATDYSINDSRMVAREIILRCLTFLILGAESYQDKDNMDLFLSKGLRLLNCLEKNSDKKLEKDYGKDILSKIKIKTYSELKNIFHLGMERNYQLFNKSAFRMKSQNSQRSPVNKSLFEVWGGTLGLLAENDFNKLIKKKDTLIAAYEEKKKELPFSRAVSRDAWKKVNVEYRFSEIEKIIKAAIND